METKGLVIVAVGLPGAGKSRFHEKFLPDAVRCSQDLLKRREKVEALVEETVRAGRVAYVDRTDLDPKQRSHWVKIAKRCKVEVVALRFTADVRPVRKSIPRHLHPILVVPTGGDLHRARQSARRGGRTRRRIK